MEKVTMKEIKKSLSLNKKIKVTGHKIFGFTKSKFEALKKGCQKSIEKVKKMVEVPKEIQKEEKDKQIAKIKEKIDEKQELINRAKKDKSVDPYYVKMLREEKKKLENKRKIKRKKGLGVFTLAKLTLVQIKNNSVKKAREFERKLKEDKLDKMLDKIQEIRRQASEKQEIINQLIANDPSLSDYYHEMFDAPLIIEADSVTEATEEEKSKVKASPKYKKAIAALTAVAVISGAVTASVSFNNQSQNDVISTNSNQVTSTYDTVQNTENIEQIDNKIEKPQLSLNSFLTLAEGSKIYETSNLDGKVGLIGLNGYNSTQLFRINAITYLDANNELVSFNLVQKSLESKDKINKQHAEFIKKNPSAKVVNFHLVPCNEFGIDDPSDMELGGWTDDVKAGINPVSTETILQNAQNALQNGRRL